MRRMHMIGVLAVALAAAAIVAGQSAFATTAPGYRFVVAFHLTNRGIVVKGPTSVPRGDTVQFLIVNQSTQRRRFYLGGRQTPLIGPRKQYVFFLGMNVRGTYPYRSYGPHVKTFRGTFKVH